MKLDKSLLKKWWFWVIGIIVLFAIIGAVNPQPKEETNKIVAENKTTDTKQEVKEVKQMTLEDAIVKEIGKKTNNKKQTLKEVLPVDNTIIISININDNISTDYVKKGFLISCNKILKILASQPYESITIKGYLDFVKKDDSVVNDIAYSYQITKSKIQEFKFDNKSYNKLETIADKFIIHSALK